MSTLTGLRPAGRHVGRRKHLALCTQYDHWEAGERLPERFLLWWRSFSHCFRTSSTSIQETPLDFSSLPFALGPQRPHSAFWMPGGRVEETSAQCPVMTSVSWLVYCLFHWHRPGPGRQLWERPSCPETDAKYITSIHQCEEAWPHAIHEKVLCCQNVLNTFLLIPGHTPGDLKSWTSGFPLASECLFLVLFWVPGSCTFSWVEFHFIFFGSLVLKLYRSMSLYFHTPSKERPLDLLFTPEKRDLCLKKSPLTFQKNTWDVTELNDFKEVFLPMTSQGQWIRLYPHFFVWKIRAYKTNFTRLEVELVSQPWKMQMPPDGLQRWHVTAVHSVLTTKIETRWESPHTHRENICISPTTRGGWADWYVSIQKYS